MNLLKLLAAAVVASLLATPGFAEPANPAGKLSLASKAQPAAAPANARGEVKPKPATLPLIAVGAAAVVGLAVLLGNNDSKPASN